MWEGCEAAKNHGLKWTSATGADVLETISGATPEEFSQQKPLLSVKRPAWLLQKAESR